MPTLRVAVTVGTMRITVIGRHTAWHDPEIARLRLEASRSGPDAAQVYDETVVAVQAVTADLRRLDADGALDTWSVHPVTTSSWRPHDPSGSPQPEEHTARAEVTADFRDPEVLSAFLARHGSTPGVAQLPVSWELTDETRARLRDEATAGAVTDAHERARVMARAADAGTVRCLALADPGLLGQGPDGGTGAISLRSAGRSEAHDEVDLRPGRIEVTAEVHATFEADLSG